MATTPIEIPKLPQGLTLTTDVFPRGSDTAAQTGIELTEATNRKGTYSGEVTAEIDGWISVKVKSGTSVIGELTTTIEDTTDAQVLEEKVFVGTNDDKTAYKLAADGLDTITATAPTGVATNFREMMVQIWRRFFKKAVRNATAIETYADDGTTVLTEQPISDAEGVETQGAASNPE
jgi:hypothetical protein